MTDLEHTSTSIRIIGDYILGNRIGGGGFGDVYKAKYKNIERQACIKIIRSKDEEANKKLLREAKVLNLLDHKHIVRLHNVTVQDDQIYLIMDYIDGGDLTTLLKKGAEPLSFEEIDTIVGQIAEGLHYAHQKEIIHQDLKPHNILRNKDGQIFIADFGIAKVLNTDLTQTFQAGSSNAGTPAYMAPEHFAGRPEYRSDFYSLGVITYELLARRRPFIGNDIQVREGHCLKPPPPLRDFNSEITDEIEQVVLKMLEKEPAKRYDSPIDFSRALHSAIVKKGIQRRMNPQTIGGFLDLIPDGDIACLEPGLYKGPFTINNRIRLVGAGSSTELYTVDEPVLRIGVSGVQLENMVIRRSHESNDEAVIHADEHISYELRNVTIQGGQPQGARWEDAQWQLPVGGYDFGRIPVEGKLPRKVPIEVKEQCVVSTTMPGLQVFPSNLSPGVHELVLELNVSGRLPGTKLDGIVHLQGETETREIHITGQVEQPSPSLLPVEQPALPPMEWQFRLQDEAARTLLRKLGSEQDKNVIKEWQKPGPRYEKLRLEDQIIHRGSILLSRLVGLKEHYWYVRRFMIDEYDQDVELWELTLASDRSTSPELLVKSEETLRLIGRIDREGRGALTVKDLRFLRAEYGVRNLSSLCALIRLSHVIQGYNGIHSEFVKQIQDLPIEGNRELDVDQLQGWEALLQFRYNLIKKRQYLVKYIKHDYRDGASRVKFFLDKNDTRDNEGNFLPYEEFQKRAHASKREKLKFLTSLPEMTNSQREHSEEIGTVEQFHAENGTIIVRLNQKIATRLEKRDDDLPGTGYLHFNVYGDTWQVERQRYAIGQLKKGRTRNPLLPAFFFDASKARPARVTKHLQPVELLSSRCNSGQVDAIEMALAAPDLLLIQGPPGTGKTTVIAEICYQVAQTGGRTLIASQSNLAVDNALGRIIHHPSIRALRKGNPDSVDYEGRDFLDERVVQTWLNNTANDCQKKLEKRNKNRAFFKELLSASSRFSRYRTAEMQWMHDQTALPRRQEQIAREISEIEGKKRQYGEEEQKYIPIQKALLALLTGDIDWSRPGVNEILAGAFHYLAEIQGKEQFIGQIQESLRLLKVLGLALPTEGHLLGSIVGLKKLLLLYSETWTKSQKHMRNAENVIGDLEIIDQQIKQVNTSIQDKKERLPPLNAEINQLIQRQNVNIHAQQNALRILQNLPSNGSEIIASKLQAFVQVEAQRLDTRVPSNTLTLEAVFPPDLVTTIQTDPSKAFSGVWQSAQRAILGRIQRVVNDVGVYHQACTRLDRCRQHFSQEWVNAPEISQGLERIQPERPPSVPQDYAAFDQLITLIEGNLYSIFQIRTKSPGIFNRFFQGQEKHQLQRLFLQTRDLLIAASECQRRNHVYQHIEENTATFAINLATELFSSLRQQLSKQDQEATTAYEKTLHDKDRLKGEYRQLQHDIEKEQTQLSYQLKAHDEQTRQIISVFQDLSRCVDIPDELRQIAERLAAFRTPILTLVVEYRTAYRSWVGNTKRLEELSEKSWKGIEATHEKLKGRLTQMRTTIVQQEQRLSKLHTEQEMLERTSQQILSDLLVERRWWSDLWETIPEHVRPMVPSEGIFSQSYLEAVQQQFAAWHLELAREETFSQRYDQLITDWVTSLQHLSGPERQRLQTVYIKNANVIGITCGQAPKLSFKEYSEFDTFDVVIIDEVSKADPLELLLPAIKGKKLILIGDQHQLPPMIEDKTLEQLAEENGEDPAAYRYLKESYFAERYRKAPDEMKCMLSIQYRMHPDIMAAINQFYEHPLECGLNQPNIERDHQIETPLLGRDKHLVWVTTPLVSSRSQKYSRRNITARNTTSGREVLAYRSNFESFAEESSGTSFVNRREAEIIEHICKEFQRVWAPKRAAGAERKEIGIITFYAAQVEELQRRLDMKDGKSSRFNALDIRVGTVDRFQGMERAVIIVSMVRNNPNREIGFAKKNERINVAFSRAQQLLVIVGCHDLFCNTAREEQATERYSNVSKIVKHRGDFIDVSSL